MPQFYKIIYFALVFLFLGCTTTSQTITKISCYSGGGELGTYAGIDITKDSVATYYRDAHKNIVVRDRFKNNFWDSLTQNITITDLKAIKSNKSTAYLDEPDASLTIETGEGKFLFLNAEIEDKGNKKMIDFLEKLGSKLAEIYAKNR